MPSIQLPPSGPTQALANFGKVSETLYRGAAPTAAGLLTLRDLGVATVIDLRNGEIGDSPSIWEAVECQALGLRYVNPRWDGLPWSRPTETQVVNLLARIAAGGTVYVHCTFGKDRTGAAMAAYRVRHDGWTAQQALDEAHFYGLHWLQFGIASFIRSL